MKEKTNEDRLKRIMSLCNEHFGDCKSVGVKLLANGKVLATVKFHENSLIDGGITEVGDDVTVVIKKLKKRVKKIISRYNNV